MRGLRLGLVGLMFALFCPDVLKGDSGRIGVRERLDAEVSAAAEGDLVPRSSDATFLRRLWLDLAGRVPPSMVVREFLDDRDPDKRARMVARLLDSDEFAGQFGRVMAEWLTADRPVVRDSHDGRVLLAYLKDNIRRGTPYSQVVRELITGSGASDSSGPANFLLRYEADPPKLAVAVGKNLLGISIACAQCHDHPFARWHRDDFWGLAASFARVRRMESSSGDDLKAVVEALRGELERPPVPGAVSASTEDAKEAEPRPRKEAAVKPRTPDGTPLPESGRRQALADWIVARDNPYLARNLVNRVWKQLFGHVLARNLDNPASKGDASLVLDLLADDFASHGYDLRRLVEIIVLSKSYGRETGPKGARSWTRPSVRPLSVDQLFESIAQATGYEGPAREGDEEMPEDDPTEPDDAHASVSMADDQPEADEPEGTDDSDRPVEMLGERALTLQRTLVVMNGEFIQEAARSAVRVTRSALGGKVGPAHIEWAFLSLLSRGPTAEEQAAMLALARTPGPKKGLEDVFWLLLNSAEFQTNH